jgi:hypothetical protein
MDVTAPLPTTLLTEVAGALTIELRIRIFVTRVV